MKKPLEATLQIKNKKIKKRKKKERRNLWKLVPIQYLPIYHIHVAHELFGNFHCEIKNSGAREINLIGR
jgi:hypothetical protein